VRVRETALFGRVRRSETHFALGSVRATVEPVPRTDDGKWLRVIAGEEEALKRLKELVDEVKALGQRAARHAPTGGAVT
jgi:malonyl CoA-acyl carrier protein transacylase